MEHAHARRLAKEVQLTDGRMAVEFHGRSMEPFLLDGDDLEVAPVAWDDIRVGDIVTYRLDERFPTFRVVRVLPSKIILRGDNWPFADFEAWPDDILGRVTARVRGSMRLRRTDAAWRWRTRMMVVDDRLRRLKRRAIAQARRIRDGLRRRVLRLASPLGELPSGLHVNVSATCNLGCKMCPYLDVHDAATYDQEMSEETFTTLLPSLRWLPSLHLSGSGEPFFNRNVIRFIEMARAVNPRIEVDITTNGTLLTERLARELVRVRVTRLVVSIDGVSEKTVGAIRIGINLPKVLANLKVLAAVKHELGKAEPIVRVNYMVGYGSYQELPDFISAAKSLGVAEVNVLEVLTGTEEAFEDNLLNSIARDGGRALRDARKRAAAAGITLVLPTTQHDACMHPYTPHVSEHGDVSPCCYVDYEGRTLWANGEAVRLPRVEYGNVRDQSFAAIWRSPAFAELRARDRTGDFPDFCRTCQSVRVQTSQAVRAVID